MKASMSGCLVSSILLVACSGGNRAGGPRAGEGGRDGGVDRAPTGAVGGGGRPGAGTGGSQGSATGGSSALATGGSSVASSGGGSAAGSPGGAAGATGGTAAAGFGGNASATGGASAAAGGAPSGSAGRGGSNVGGAGGAGNGAGGAAGAAANAAGGANGGVRANTCLPAGTAPTVVNARVPAGFCAYTWADGVSGVRGIAVASNGDVLAVESGTGRVVALYDDNADGRSDATERVTLATQPGLNHGIVVGGGFLYASTPSTVYRWAYSAGARATLGAAQIVVAGIPTGGHSTRTLRIGGDHRLYVTVGSGSNVDPNAARAGIRRFDLSVATFPADGVDFFSGEVFADGMRNEVGLAFDSQDRLWGVENGTDDVARPDLGNVHEDNPAEELNLFAEAGRFYGYPYCWSEFLLPPPTGMGPGTQWAHEIFWMDGTHSDAWCRDPINVVRPVATMPAHTAPLGITFYTGGSFPPAMVGGAFVALHGSWDRTTPIGYSVVYFPFNAGSTAGPMQSFFEFVGPGATDATSWPHRPVDVAVGTRGQLFVTSDASNSIFWIGHDGT